MSALTAIDVTEVEDRETPDRETPMSLTPTGNLPDEIEKPVATVSPNEERPHELSAIRQVILMVGLSLNMFVANILTTAIPNITDEFKDLNSVAWYGAAFFLTTACMQGPWGKMYKFFNLKGTILAALFIFELGSLICATAQSNIALIVGRAVQGFGNSGLTNGTYTIVGIALPPNRRPMFTGVLGGILGFTSVLGPFLGGMFTQSLTWRWCFYINLPLGAAIALILVLAMRTPKQNPRERITWKEIAIEMDPLGVALLAVAAICILLALGSGGIHKAWDSSFVIGCLVGCVLISAAFIADQWYLQEKASFPLRIFKRRNVAIGIIWNGIMGGAFITHMFLLPLYFQVILGASPIGSGLHNMPLIIAFIVTSIAGATFVTKMGMPMYVMLIGSIIASVGSGLLYTFGANTSEGQWIGYLVLLGLGYGFILQMGVVVGQAASKPEDMAVTTATINFALTYGGALCLAVAQNIFSNTLIERIDANVIGVDPRIVINTGATDFRNELNPEQLNQVLVVFMSSLKDAFIVPIPLVCFAFFLALLLTKDMRIRDGINNAAAD